jgi:hypothetical protein
MSITKNYKQNEIIPAKKRREKRTEGRYLPHTDVQTENLLYIHTHTFACNIKTVIQCDFRRTYAACTGSGPYLPDWGTRG